MRNFIIFFKEKEGTSPLVRLLDNFEKISIIHQVNNLGWEPFDIHNCGPLPLTDLERCLDIIFSDSSVDFDKLNRIYTKTASNPLEEISENAKAVGFKMRFRPPEQKLTQKFSSVPKLSWVFERIDMWPFQRKMIKLLKRNEVVVFLAVRQDVLRWALSKYHGDGTGKTGHLQFKLAGGEISRDDIGKIHVDCNRLKKIIAFCEKLHARKRRLAEKLRQQGIQTYPLIYEDFLTDKQHYFSKVMDYLDIEVSQNEIKTALEQGTIFKKVHSEDISDFVINHKEVKDRFSDRFISWRQYDVPSTDHNSVMPSSK